MEVKEKTTRFVPQRTSVGTQCTRLPCVLFVSCLAHYTSGRWDVFGIWVGFIEADEAFFGTSEFLFYYHCLAV